MSQSISSQLWPHHTSGFRQVWLDAIRAINVTNRYAYHEGGAGYSYGPHRWFTDLYSTYALHPVIAMLVDNSVRPKDWQQMLLEWPHVSRDDETLLAYTRDDAYGQSDRQVRTTLGKYLARHYGHLPSHMLRDIAGTHTPSNFEIWDTSELIIAGIELGAQSCMKSSYGSIPFNNDDNEALLAWHAGNTDVEVRWDRHPYRVYDPKHGWAMAVRLDKGKPDVVLGRALVYTDPDKAERKFFVRSYMRSESSSYSQSDDKLETWLREQGYERRTCWPAGAELSILRHPTKDGYMLPYIDGCTQRVSMEGNTFQIDENGEYLCTNTDGTPDAPEYLGECDDCGETLYEDDDNHVYVGEDSDTLVCCRCCRRNYTEVRGNNRYNNRYFVRDDRAVEVRGEQYDSDDLPDYIVWSEPEDEYMHIDDVVFCVTDDEYYTPESDAIVRIDGEWYRRDDMGVVECFDNEYRLKSDCWQSALGNWHGDEIDYTEVTAGKYSADELTEMADNI
jgi:hypothetical protein